MYLSLSYWLYDKSMKNLKPLWQMNVQKHNRAAWKMNLFTTLSRACGHVDVGTCPHQVLSTPSFVHTKFWQPPYLNQRGQIMPALYWCPQFNYDSSNLFSEKDSFFKQLYFVFGHSCSFSMITVLKAKRATRSRYLVTEKF